VKELSEQINGDYQGTVVVLSTVRVVEKDGEKKEYEQIYNQASMPGYVMKYIKISKIDKTFIDIAKNLDRKKRSKLQHFVLQVTDSQYGVKDFYTLGELEPYDPAKNIAASDKVINDDDTGY
jgi:predicted dinucleotide-binding enzyme